MAAVLLLEVATAAAVIPLNFAATACSADHISLFSVYYFFTVISNFDEQQILPQIFSSVHSFFFCSAFPFRGAAAAVANAEIPVQKPNQLNALLEWGPSKLRCTPLS